MCFNTESDWTASVNEVTEGPSPARVRCGECHQWINVGEWRKFVHQEEHEECELCRYDGCECPKDHLGFCNECKCEKPDFGNEFDATICEPCSKLLKAIMHAELVAGCAPSESQPAYGELREAIQEDDKYIDVALQMFPEVAAHIDRMIGYHPERVEETHELIELGEAGA